MVVTLHLDTEKIKSLVSCNLTVRNKNDVTRYKAKLVCLALMKASYYFLENIQHLRYKNLSVYFYGNNSCLF
jgi:hypothetical protein